MVLEIQNLADLEWLLPLLERLRIRYTRKEESTPLITEEAAIAYHPSYDESYLQDLIQKASQN